MKIQIEDTVYEGTAAGIMEQLRDLKMCIRDRGDTMDGIPGKDATYTGYHYTKAVCETCGGINTNMSKSEYGYLKNVYWLYDLSLIHI